MQRSNQHPGALLRHAGLSLLLLAAACTDLGAVRDWSGASAGIDGFGAGAERFAGRPLGQVRVTPPTQHQALRDIAAMRQRQVGQLKALAGTVGLYMETMNRLAGDGVPSMGGEVEVLGGRLGAVGLPADRAEAGIGVLAVVSDAALAGVQSSRLRRMIEDGNDPLHGVLGGMIDIAEAFRLDLEIERARWLDGFVALQTPSSPVQRILWQDWVTGLEARLRREEEAADALTAALRIMASGHQALFDSRDDIDAVALARRLSDEAGEIGRALGQVRDAFGN
ncbi:MAG: hypothetical protein AAFV86_06730 [Pseudomonadota bacterium]